MIKVKIYLTNIFRAIEKKWVGITYKDTIRKKENREQSNIPTIITAY